MVIELFLIGVGLSMDAFAVSVCKGLGMEKINNLYDVKKARKKRCF
jgi:putative Mn2+ efflux pump MntP